MGAWGHGARVTKWLVHWFCRPLWQFVMFMFFDLLFQASANPSLDICNICLGPIAHLSVALGIKWLWSLVPETAMGFWASFSSPRH